MNRDRFVQAALAVVGMGANPKDQDARYAFASLIAPGEDWPNARDMMQMSTCALVAAGVWRAAGVEADVLRRPYVVGSAVSRLIAIANHAGAWVPWRADARPGLGDMVLLSGPEHVYTVTGDDGTTFATSEGGARDAEGYQCVIAGSRTWHGRLDGGRLVAGWVDCTRLPGDEEPDTDPNP